MPSIGKKALGTPLLMLNTGTNDGRTWSGKQSLEALEVMFSNVDAAAMAAESGRRRRSEAAGKRAEGAHHVCLQ